MGGPAEKPVCEHDWEWVSPAGTSNFARLCRICHEPNAGWLNQLEITHHDEGTLFKVYRALINAGLSDKAVLDCVNEMQNAGLYFRERCPTNEDVEVCP